MSDWIGKTLGQYQIIEPIGAGGMAKVFKAYQPSVDRYVAVKVMAFHCAADLKFLERFRREARAVAQLEHAHILPLHDYGEVDGCPYLVMRYLEAGKLKHRLTSGRLSVAEVNHILGQVGSGLDYAHRHGVVHRDVKPSNVLLDSEGNAFLSDFGVARIAEATSELTRDGVGTPAT